jgi:hypothetical protein
MGLLWLLKGERVVTFTATEARLSGGLMFYREDEASARSATAFPVKHHKREFCQRMTFPVNIHCLCKRAKALSTVNPTLTTSTKMNCATIAKPKKTNNIAYRESFKMNIGTLQNGLFRAALVQSERHR